VVDELCNVIMKGCTLDDFKKAIKELLQNEEEEKKESENKEEIKEFDEKFDYSTIGTKGWNMIHKACSAGNHDVVEYLLLKK